MTRVQHWPADGLRGLVWLWVLVHFTRVVAAIPSGRAFWSNGGYGFTAVNAAFPSGNVDKTISLWVFAPIPNAVASVLSIAAVTGNAPNCDGNSAEIYLASVSKTDLLGICNRFQNNWGSSGPNTDVLGNQPVTPWKNWVYLAISYSASSGVVSVYANGNFIMAWSGKSYPAASVVNFAMVTGWGIILLSKLMLDDVRVWSRPLSATDVWADFSNPLANSTGLVLQWDFENVQAVTNTSLDTVAGLACQLVGGATVVNLSQTTGALACTVGAFTTATSGWVPTACPAGTHCPRASCLCAGACLPCPPG